MHLKTYVKSLIGFLTSVVMVRYDINSYKYDRLSFMIYTNIINYIFVPHVTIILVHQPCCANLCYNKWKNKTEAFHFYLVCYCIFDWYYQLNWNDDNKVGSWNN